MSEEKGEKVKESVRVLRFLIIGTLNALIIVVVISIMMFLLDCGYLWSNAAGYTVALINTFFWNKYWVFTSPGGSFWREAALFLLAFACAYGLQFLALLLMVEIIGINEYLAQLLGALIYGTVNFIMNRKVTFQEKKKR